MGYGNQRFEASSASRILPDECGSRHWHSEPLSDTFYPGAGAPRVTLKQCCSCSGFQKSPYGKQPALMLRNIWLYRQLPIENTAARGSFLATTHFSGSAAPNLPAARLLPASKQIENSHWPLVCMYAESQVFSDQRVCL